MRFFVGGYSRDLYLAELDAESGAMHISSSVDTGSNASFLAWVPETSTVYATAETGTHPAESGSLSAFRLHDSGMTRVSDALSCGAGPCHLAVDASRRLLVAANYAGGSIVALSLAGTGEFETQLSCVQHEGQGPNTARQERAHAHSTNMDVAHRAVYVCDLGTDEVVRYQLSALQTGDYRDAGASALKLRPGSGPRHLAFSTDDRYAYVATELSNTVLACSHDPDTGVLTPVQELSLLPEGYEGEALAAEVQLHPDGAFLYVSVRGPDLIVVFGRDPSTGRLEPFGSFSSGGAWPRHFHIHESGTFMLVANERSNTVSSFRIDPQSGLGIATGHTLDTEAPSCALFAGEAL